MTGQLPCPVCGYGNRPGAQVCEDCGLVIPQFQACAACGFMNTADSRFCGSCGTPVGIERKQSAGPSAPRTNPAPPPAPAPAPPPAPALASSPTGPLAPLPAPQFAPQLAPPVATPPAPQLVFPKVVRDPLVGRGDAPAPRAPVPVFRLVHEGTGVEIRLPLQDGDLIIGRPGGDPDVDVSGFPEATVVSRKHARLIVSAGKVSIEDLGSANGTYLNNSRVRGAAPLTDGDRVAFGQGAKVVFTVRLST